MYVIIRYNQKGDRKMFDFDGIFSDLLDLYIMDDWGMSWEEFLCQFENGLKEEIKIWKKEQIGIDN
jgi:hypothetical protein